MSKDDYSDFETGSKAKKEPRRLGLAPLVQVISWGLIVVFLCFGLPRLEALFQDFGVDLPGSAKILIKASHFAVSYLAILAPLLVVLVALNLYLLHTLARKGDGNAFHAWSVFSGVVPVVVLVLMVLGLVLPLISLFSMHGLSG
jgi:hypothetical protein